MPYIKKEDRPWFDPALEKLPKFEEAGELNYFITRVCDKYLLDKGKRYANINDIIGALECAKIEFYRRVVAAYEDKKIIENGDAYDNWNTRTDSL